MNMYRLLLIDDDEAYCRTFSDNVRMRADINIEYRHNLEDGIKILREKNLHGVILDAKCLLSPEQETDNTVFVSEAINDLDRVGQEFDRIIPFVINTAYPDDATLNHLKKKLEAHKSRVFSKIDQSDELLDHLIRSIENAPSTKIENGHRDVFEIFDKGYLGEEYRQRLITILKNKNTKYYRNDLKNSFNELRQMLEEIYRTIYAKRHGILDDRLFERGSRPSLSWFSFHLSGQDVKHAGNPAYIPRNESLKTDYSNAIRYLTEMSQKFSHDNKDRWHFFDVSNYTYQSAVYCLLEAMLWFKRIMEENNR